MALVHNVTFKTPTDMIVELAEIFMQFDEINPAPKWWKRFQDWVESEGIDTLEELRKRLEKIAAMDKKDQPFWFKNARTTFRKSDTVRMMTVKTPILDGDDSTGSDVLASTREDEDLEPTLVDDAERVDDEEVDDDEDNDDVASEDES